MKRNVPPQSIEVICASLSDNTLRQYECAFKRWFDFCSKNNINPYDAPIEHVIKFLTDIFIQGAQYGTLNSYRSALALILGSKISSDDIMSRLFKGFYRLRPSVPKYNSTWDTSIVLDYLGNFYPNSVIGLETLTKKLITLLALITAHRVQTLSLIRIENITISDLDISIKIPDTLKTSRIGSIQPNLIIPFYSIKPEICPANTLISYLEQTKSLRGEVDRLFISFRKPYNQVSSQTLSRWIKDTLFECGIDTSVFTAHSTRHASTSNAKKLGVNIDTIKNTAGWSGNSKVFAKFYNRNIINNNDCHEFAVTILNNNNLDN